MREFIKPELCKRLLEAGCGNYATVTGRPDIKLLKNVSFQEAFCMLPYGFCLKEFPEKMYCCCNVDMCERRFGLSPIKALESMLEKLLDEGYTIKDGRLGK